VSDFIGCNQTRFLLEQDILIHCLSLDRRGPDTDNGLGAAIAKSPAGDRWHGWGPGAVPKPEDKAAKGSGVSMAGTVKRRRSRQAVPRPKVVQFSLTEDEFAEVSKASARSGLARGAFAAEAALAMAREAPVLAWSPLREASVELMSAAGLVRRVGTNLNQAVARLNATGQRGEDLVPAAQFCARVIRHLDEAAEQVCRNVP
jgi:hypothetical protein